MIRFIRMIKVNIFLADIIARSIAPEADIPDLPDDLFIQISGYDKGDSGVFMESSLAGLNIAPLWDNDAKTILETDFSGQTECWFSVELPRSAGLKAIA